MTSLNFTGRQRLDKDGIALRISGSPDDVRLSIGQLYFDGLGLPENARVVVEAQRQTNYMRFECGRAANVLHLDQVPLSEFDSPEGILFRVKVIGDDDSDVGKLLAVADKIRATDEGYSGYSSSEGQTGQESILPFLSRELGQLAWLVDFSDDRPVLLVNRNLPDWKALVKSPEFRVFVLPVVLRQIALWVVRRDAEDETRNSPVWRWKKFLELLGTPSPDIDEDKYEEWADDVAHTFARQASLLDGLVGAIDTGEGD